MGSSTLSKKLRWKEFGIMMDFKAKAIAVDEITMPMRNINQLQKQCVLGVPKLNTGLAKEPTSTQNATKCAEWILDAKYDSYQMCRVDTRCQI